MINKSLDNCLNHQLAHSRVVRLEVGLERPRTQTETQVAKRGSSDKRCDSVDVGCRCAGKNHTRGGNQDAERQEKGPKQSQGRNGQGEKFFPRQWPAPSTLLGPAGCAQGDFLEPAGAFFRAHGYGRN